MTVSNSIKFSLNLVGLRFGRLVAVEFTGKKKDGHRLWLCKCDCGKDHIAKASLLKANLVKSCGCYRVELASRTKRVHGGCMDGRRSKLYRAWSSLRERCNNTTHHAYSNYGGRGISVCERWDSFEAFKSDMGEPAPGLSLDRIDANGNYEPENCRWAAISVQNSNKRNTIRICIDGVEKTPLEWEKISGVKADTISKRFKLGHSPEDCVFAKDLRFGPVSKASPLFQSK